MCKTKLIMNKPKQKTLFQSWGKASKNELVKLKDIKSTSACSSSKTTTGEYDVVDLCQDDDDDDLLTKAMEESMLYASRENIGKKASTDAPSTSKWKKTCARNSQQIQIFGKPHSHVSVENSRLFCNYGKPQTSGKSSELDVGNISLGAEDMDVGNISLGAEDIEADLLQSGKDLSINPEFAGFDKSAGRLWIYPTNYPIRDYQYNIVQTSLFKNTLVTLPTGLGKTFIAAVVMYNFYRWYPQGKIVFMAPTKPLVAQQIEACYKIMGIPQENTAEMTGSMNPTDRRKSWHKKRVFFLTPQVLTNDLSRGTCPVEDIKCLVIDEAHKALGNHAYCQVVRETIKYTQNFRILALSATPGSDIKAVQQVLTNLLISHIEIRTEECIDIKPYTHERKVEKIVIPLGEELNKIKTKFIQVITVVVSRLVKYGVLYRRDPASLSKFLLLKSRDMFRQNPPEKLPQAQFGVVEGDFALGMSLYHAFELLQLHGLRPFYNFLNGIVHGEKSFGRTRAELLRNADFNDIMETLRDKFANNGSSTLSQQPTFVSGHPKLEKLEEIVLEHFRNFHNSDDDKTSCSTRVMIFSQYRDSVEEIRGMLNRHQPVIKVMSFIGQSSAGKVTKGFTQKEQLKVMKGFREGGYNTLVSTCVGEEGLDIGDVDLIICFDAHKSPIRLIQRMGRTGRKRKGKIIMLVTEGKEEQIYNQSQYSKRSIHKAIQNGAKSLHFYQNNQRLCPEDLTPTCHKMFMTVKQMDPPKKTIKKPTIKSLGGNIKKFAISDKRSALKEDGGITREEYEELKEFILPEAEVKKLQKSCFHYLSRKKEDCENTNKQESVQTKLSLMEWLPWQNRMQTTRFLDHSSKTKYLVDLMEFSELQQLLPAEEDSYGLEMRIYLNDDDILKPGQNNQQAEGILKFCSKKDNDQTLAEKKTSKNKTKRISDKSVRSKRSEILPIIEVIEDQSDEDLPMFDIGRKKPVTNEMTVKSTKSTPSPKQTDKCPPKKKKQETSGNKSVIQVIADVDREDFEDSIPLSLPTIDIHKCMETDDALEVQSLDGSTNHSTHAVNGEENPTLCSQLFKSVSTCQSGNAVIGKEDPTLSSQVFKSTSLSQSGNAVIGKEDPTFSSQVFKSTSLSQSGNAVIGKQDPTLSSQVFKSTSLSQSENAVNGEEDPTMCQSGNVGRFRVPTPPCVDELTEVFELLADKTCLPKLDLAYLVSKWKNNSHGETSKKILMDDIKCMTKYDSHGKSSKKMVMDDIDCVANIHVSQGERSNKKVINDIKSVENFDNCSESSKEMLMDDIDCVANFDVSRESLKEMLMDGMDCAANIDDGCGESSKEMLIDNIHCVANIDVSRESLKEIFMDDISCVANFDIATVSDDSTQSVSSFSFDEETIPNFTALKSIKSLSNDEVNKLSENGQMISSKNNDKEKVSVLSSNENIDNITSVVTPKTNASSRTISNSPVSLRYGVNENADDVVSDFNKSHSSKILATGKNFEEEMSPTNSCNIVDLVSPIHHSAGFQVAGLTSELDVKETDETSGENQDDKMDVGADAFVDSFFIDDFCDSEFLTPTEQTTPLTKHGDHVTFTQAMAFVHSTQDLSMGEGTCLTSANDVMKTNIHKKAKLSDTLENDPEHLNSVLIDKSEGETSCVHLEKIKSDVFKKNFISCDNRNSFPNAPTVCCSNEYKALNDKHLKSVPDSYVSDSECETNANLNQSNRKMSHPADENVSPGVDKVSDASNVCIVKPSEQTMDEVSPRKSEHCNDTFNFENDFLLAKFDLEFDLDDDIIPPSPSASQTISKFSFLRSQRSNRSQRSLGFEDNSSCFSHREQTLYSEKQKKIASILYEDESLDRNNHENTSSLPLVKQRLNVGKHKNTSSNGDDGESQTFIVEQRLNAGKHKNSSSVALAEQRLNAGKHENTSSVALAEQRLNAGIHKNSSSVALAEQRLNAGKHENSSSVALAEQTLNAGKHENTSSVALAEQRLNAGIHENSSSVALAEQRLNAGKHENCSSVALAEQRLNAEIHKNSSSNSDDDENHSFPFSPSLLEPHDVGDDETQGMNDSRIKSDAALLRTPVQDKTCKRNEAIVHNSTPIAKSSNIDSNSIISRNSDSRNSTSVISRNSDAFEKKRISPLSLSRGKPNDPPSPGDDVCITAMKRRASPHESHLKVSPKENVFTSPFGGFLSKKIEVSPFESSFNVSVKSVLPSPVRGISPIKRQVSPCEDNFSVSTVQKETLKQVLESSDDEESFIVVKRKKKSAVLLDSSIESPDQSKGTKSKTRQREKKNILQIDTSSDDEFEMDKPKQRTSLLQFQIDDEDEDFTDDQHMKPAAKQVSTDSRLSKKKRKLCDFIEYEAVLSGEEGGSSDGDSSDMDVYENSFVNDNTQLTQQDVDMRVVYLDSVRSPVTKNRKHGSSYSNVDVFSQLPPEDDTQYMEDSFCVNDEFEDDEEEDSSPIKIKSKPSKKTKVVKGKKRICQFSHSSSDDEQIHNTQSPHIEKHLSRKKVIKALISSSEEESPVKLPSAMKIPTSVREPFSPKNCHFTEMSLRIGHGQKVNNQILVDKHTFNKSIAVDSDFSKTYDSVVSKTSDSSVSKTSDHSIKKTFNQSVIKTSGQGVSKSFNQSVSKTSDQGLSKTFNQSGSKTSNCHSSKTSDQDLSKTFNQSVSKTSDHGLSKTFNQSSSKTSNRDSNESSVSMESARREREERLMKQKLKQDQFRQAMLMKEKSQNVSKNLYAESVGKNMYAESVGKNMHAESVGKNMYAESVGKNMYADSVGKNMYAESVVKNMYAESVGKNMYAESFGKNMHADGVGKIQTHRMESNVLSSDVKSGRDYHETSVCLNDTAVNDTFHNEKLDSSLMLINPQHSSRNRGKLVVLVDSREISGAQDIVSSLRLQHQFHVVARQLTGCDYILSNRLAVDRKQLSEFSNGANRKKLIDRIQTMQSLYDRCCVIVEKDRVKPGEEKSPRASHRSKYVDWTMAFLSQSSIKLLFSDSQGETATLISELCQLEAKKGMNISVPVDLNPQQEQIFQFYASIPHLNCTHVLCLCHNFKSVSEFLNSTSKVISVKGQMSQARAEDVYKFIKHKFDIQMLPSRR